MHLLMPLPIKRVLAIIILSVINHSFGLAQAGTTRKITAGEIIQKALDNEGGDAKLDSITAVEFISQIVTAKGDTLSYAVKRKGFDKYYISVLSAAYENSTTIYNKGKATIVKNEQSKNINDVLILEDLKLQSYISINYGYKKMGYKLERLDDQKFKNFDCYVVMAESGLDKRQLNYYDKKTGDLIMCIYPNGNKSVFIDFYEAKGVRCPSAILMVDTANDITKSRLTKIDYDENLDDNWFTLPAEGHYVAPDIFKEGTYKYINSNTGVTMTRTKDSQVEIDGNSKHLFKISWISDNDYLLYGDASNPPEVKKNGYLHVRIITWSGNKYYCHYQTENGIGGTCAFEKIK